MTTDFIADVHGHADALEALLERLGYAHAGGAWRAAGRRAVFLGDLIDRGPRQLDVIRIVRSMRDAGVADAVMGNHEFNAIAYATEDPARPGAHLRPRTGNNVAQHAAFVDAVGLDSALHRETVAFFMEMPLWLDDGTARAVHACWSDRDMAVLAPHVDSGNRLTAAGFLATQERGSPAYASAEVLCKGPEVALPHGVTYCDHGGHVRDRSRTRWWDPSVGTLAAGVMDAAVARAVGQAPFPEGARIPHLGGTPVFFGHYWLEGEPTLLTPDRACLDFSVAKDGHLCAYSHDGERVLDPARLTWVPAHPDHAPAHP